MVNYVEKVQSRTLLSSILGLDETYYAHPLTHWPTELYCKCESHHVPSKVRFCIAGDSDQGLVQQTEKTIEHRQDAQEPQHARQRGQEEI